MTVVGVWLGRSTTLFYGVLISETDEYGGRDFMYLEKSSMPSVLVEVGFVTGREDAPLLASSAYRDQMAAAIASVFYSILSIILTQQR